MNTGFALMIVVPLPRAANDDKEFALLEQWLKSYGPEELFHIEVDSGRPETRHQGRIAEGIIDGKALRIIPKDQQRRMGMVDVSVRSASPLINAKETYHGFIPLETPDWKEFGHEKDEEISNMEA
jgi:xylulose-5-phosphate/fructose-6-phosphate phosphoketolase